MAPKTSVDAPEEGVGIIYNPKTELGNGFFPLISRAWVRSLVVANAVFRGWPIAHNVADAEISEGLQYLNNISDKSLAAMSDSSKKQFRYIKKLYEKLASEVSELSAKNPEGPMDNALDDKIHEITNCFFAFMQQLDYETLGITAEYSDAGKKL